MVTIMDVTITQKKMKGKEDSFFYEGEIASVTKPNKTKLVLVAAGDIRLVINGETYKDSTRAEFDYKLTDKKLKDMERRGKLVWDNNWFEVIWKKKGDSDFECDEGVADTYDEAIRLLRNYEDDNY